MEKLISKSPTLQRKTMPTDLEARGVHRRSTNACRRCKRRKIKCFYNSEDNNSKCVACTKARCDCLFDVPPDGVLRGDAYVSTLEARIQNLERQLREKNSELLSRTRPSLTPDTSCFDVPLHEGDTSEINNVEKCSKVQENNLMEMVSNPPFSPPRPSPGVIATSPAQTRISTSDITVLELLHSRTFTAESEDEVLPSLPPTDRARALVDTAYFYTQARYCIVDWAQLCEWHQYRESIAYASPDAPVDTQAGAFFIWIIYAIGARLVQNPEHSNEAYFARARVYLPAVMSLQNLTTVQALLCLVQYYFRAPNQSPIWDLTGLALRLCVKLRYHRQATSSPNTPGLDPYTIELQKRFFWCAYCFDRCMGILTKLPFSIRDSDIDVDLPIDIDDTCKDAHILHDLQMKQVAGHTLEQGAGSITTMTAALHHLQVYRIRSKILTDFTGPHSHGPSPADVESILLELHEWRQRAPQKDSRSFPQQNPDRVQSTYLQAILLLVRPILVGNTSETINPDLIRLCVDFAVDAAESAKVLSLNPQTLPDRFTVYHCFYCSIALLQCLVIMPTALTPRSIHQAISSYHCALAIYTRALPAVAPFLRLFEKLSNVFICENQDSEIHVSAKVRDVLNRIVSSDPSETSGILNSLSQQESQQSTIPSTPAPPPLEIESMEGQYDSILGGQSAAMLGASESGFPLEIPLDISPMYAPDADITDWWTGAWLDPAATDFSQLSATGVMD